MEEIFDYFALICAGIGACIGWFFGGTDGLIVALIAFTCMDYVTGVISAGINHKLDSRVGFKGIAKKVVIFVLVGIANVIDKQLLSQMPFFKNAAILREGIILFFCANEGISILENADNIGVPIPQQLRKLFVQLKNKDKEHSEKTNVKKSKSLHSGEQLKDEEVKHGVNDNNP